MYFIFLIFISLMNAGNARSIHRTMLQYMPDSIDPTKANDTNAQFVIMNSHDGLVGWDAAIGIYPQLAETWTFSADKLEVKFKLKKNLKFSNGTKLSSTDVKKHFERLKSSKTFGNHFDNILQIKIPNELEVVFNLKKKTPFFVHLLAGSHSRIVKMENGTFVGAGPFIPNKSSSKIDLFKNSNYWGQPPKVDQISMQVIEEKTAFEKLFLSQIDDAILAPYFKSETLPLHIQSQSQNMWATWAIAFDQRVQPFDKKWVRKEILTSLSAGRFEDLYPGNFPAYGIQSIGMPGYLSENVVTSYPKTPKSEKLENVSITIPLEISNSNLLVKWIKNNSPKCCTLSPILTPFAEIMSNFGKSKNGAVLLSFNAEYPDPSFLIRSLHENSQINFLGTKNETLLNLIANAENTTDSIERAHILRKINVLLVEDFSFVPLMHVSHRALLRSCVSGIKLSPLSEGYFSLREVENKCE